MMFEQRAYQTEAIDAIFDYWQWEPDGNPLVEMATGTGKAFVIASLCRELLTVAPGARLLMLVHVRELVRQNFEELVKHWPGAPAGINSAGLGRRDTRAPILCASIQSIYKHGSRIGPRDVIIIDEAHLLSPNNASMYQKLISDLRAQGELRIVGFTATPYRMDCGRLDAGPDRLFSKTVYSYGIADGVRDGYLSPLISKGMASEIDVRNVAKRGGEFVAGALEAAADNDAIIEGAVTETIQYGQDRRSWLMFCSGVKHALHVRDAFRRRGVSCETVTGETPTDERDRILADFKAGRIRCLTNMSVLTTGFNAPGVDLVGLLRPTLSTSLYCLDTETEVLTSHGWKSRKSVSVGDCALSVNMESGKGEWSLITGTIYRPMDDHEKWVSYEAPRANFRVTGDHRMIFATKTREGRTPWKIGSALEMASFKDGVYMPTALHIDAPGVPLSAAELYIIGIIMTDGTVSSHQVTIYQSERHPEIIERIESALNMAGIAWVKSRIKVKTKYEERFSRWRYSISAGDPRSGKPGKGIRYLYPFIDKDFSPALFAMSKEQFKHLMQGIWDGDGFKTDKCPSVDWTPRGWSLCCARKTTIERLQILAVMHGFTAHLRWERSNRKNPIGIITITDQDWRSVGGSGNRPQIVVSSATDEMVWCVETTNGTIVTRRRGKVTVMGNCQMLGRGTRLAHGKANCLVLDFSGNVRRHGAVDDLETVRASGVAGEAKEGAVAVNDVRLTACPHCRSYISPRARICPECNEVVKEEPKHDARADTAQIMSGVALAKGWRTVDAIAYARHASGFDESKPDTFRVEYSSGRKLFREWVCFDHPQGTFPRRKAATWWFENGGTLPPPESVAKALERKGELKFVELIKVEKDERDYDRITAKRFVQNQERKTA